MARRELTPSMMQLVGERFRALAEPARLHLLHSMRDGEMTVTDLVHGTGLGQANVSKHLRLLHSLGFVTRRKDGLFTYYALADDSVFTLCELMCNHIDAEARARSRLVEP